MTQTIQENYSWTWAMSCVPNWDGQLATQFNG